MLLWSVLSKIWICGSVGPTLGSEVLGLSVGLGLAGGGRLKGRVSWSGSTVGRGGATSAWARRFLRKLPRAACVKMNPESWKNRSRASFMAVADWNRSSGRTARPCSTVSSKGCGTSGFALERGSNSPEIKSDFVFALSSLRNGWTPASIS